MAAELVILGVLLYFIAWFAHDKGGVPRPRLGPGWRESPTWVRRLLRRGSGPILPLSVAVELAGFFSVLRGVASINGSRGDAADALTASAMAATFVLIGAVWIALYATNRTK